MSLDEVIRRAIIKVETDAKDAEKGLKSLSKTTDSTSKSLDTMASKSENAQRALDTIGLGADKSVTKIQALGSHFQSFTGKIGGGISALASFSQRLGPWNQALEVGGKFLGGLNAGLESFAKTSPQAASEVAALTKEFTDLKDSAMSALGAITVGLAKAIPFANELESTIHRMRLGEFQTAVNVAFLKGQPVGTDDESEYAKARSQATLDPNQFYRFINVTVQNALNDLAKKPGPSKFENFIGGVRTDTAGKPIGFSPNLSLGQAAFYDTSGEGATTIQIEKDRMKGLTSDWMSRLGTQQGKKNSFLESTFGTIDEFNGYASAFSTLTGAVTTGLKAWIDGSMSAGQAIKKFLSDSVAGLASEMAVQALRHGAYALGSLAFGDAKGAATHGAAAAKFGAAAIVAGAVAKSMGGGGSTSAPSGSASSGGYSGSASGGGGPPQTVQTIYIVQGDSHSEDSPRLRQRNAERVVELGLSRAQSVVGTH